MMMMMILKYHGFELSISVAGATALVLLTKFLTMF